MQKQRIILHIDFDSFFASVEQQSNSLLRGKPIGVTAQNGRNCIIAASREAKKLGIKSPSRVTDAKKICPTFQAVPADFVKYWEVSKKFINIAKDFSPYVEVFSIDEVFMDVTLTARLFGGTHALIEKLKTRLREEVGDYITVSVGISYNKLLAKLASGLRKPNGIMEVHPEDVPLLYRHLPVTEICGIGNGIAARLRQMGISTVFQLRLVPLPSLIAEFGTVEGKFLKNVGLGIDNRTVMPYTMITTVKSVGRNYCLPHNEYDHRRVLQNVYELCEEVALKLRRLNKATRTIGISLRGSVSTHGTHTFPHPMDTGREIFEACLFITGGTISGYVRQISIYASTLEDINTLPSPLFLKDRKQKKLTPVIDKLNDKFGHHTIRNGFLLYADKLTTVPNGWMADRYERLKLSTA